MASSYRGTACFYAYHSILHPDKWGSWQENNEGWFERQKERVAKKEKVKSDERETETVKELAFSQEQALKN